MQRRAVSRRGPVGRAARRRRQASRPRAIGRSAASVGEWAAIRPLILARARGRCQACGSPTPLDVHHVTKRAQGGSDFDLDGLVALCRPCHEWTDAPYVRGRLVVTPLGAGRFTFALVRGTGKGASEVLDQWESLWPPTPEAPGDSGVGFYLCGQTNRSAAGEAFPPTPPRAGESFRVRE